MERKEMEDKEERAALDSPERDSAPVTDDAQGGGVDERDVPDAEIPGRSGEPWAPGDEGAPDERVVGTPWWEGGPGPEEAASDEPETHEAAGYMYRGVRYGEAVPEIESRAPEELNDDDPVDLSVLAVMSEDQPAVPPAEGGAAGQPVAGPAWWEGGPRPGEADDDDDPADPSVLAVMSEDQPAVPPAEGGAAAEPVAKPDWWEGASRLEEAAQDEADTRVGEAAPEPQSQPTEEPDDDDDPVETPGPPVMSEDRPAVAPAHAGAAREPVVESPWWERGSKPAAAAEERPDDESSDADSGEPYLYSGMDFGDSVPEPQSQPPEELNDAEPTDVAVPAATSEDQPAAAAAEGREDHAGEDPLADDGGPASQADLSAAKEALPEGSPDELIRSIVADICPDELLLVGTAQPSLPEWAGAAVTALRNDLDRRQAEHNPSDANEYLRLAVVENAMGLHEEAEGHLKEALPRSDRFGPFLNALAVTSLARGRVAPAIVYCKEALRETGGDDFVRAAASSNLGDLYDLQGDAAQATEAYETAIDCLQAQGDSRRLSRLHLRVGHLYRRVGQADKARLHYSDSVRLFKDSGDEAGHVQSLAALGSSLTASGLHDLALRSFEEAVRICLRTADKPGAALVQDELGVAYMAQDQLTRAIAYFESALSLHRELGNRRSEAATLSQIGKIHDSRGDVDEARRFYEAAKEIDRALGHDADEAGREPQIASGDQEAARAKILRAEEIFSRAGSAELQEDVRRTTGRHGRETGGFG